MLLCSKCSAALRPSAKLCVRCGTAAQSDPTPAPSANPLLATGTFEASPTPQESNGSRGSGTPPSPAAVGAQSIVKDLTASAQKAGVFSDAAFPHAKTLQLTVDTKLLVIAVLAVGIVAAGIFAFVQWRSKSSSEAVVTASNSAEARPQADALGNAIPLAVQPNVVEQSIPATSTLEVEGNPTAPGQAVAVLPPIAITAPGPAIVTPRSVKNFPTPALTSPYFEPAAISGGANWTAVASSGDWSALQVIIPTLPQPVSLALFKPAFYSDGVFTQALMGDAAALKRVRLPDSVARVVLIQADQPETTMDHDSEGLVQANQTISVTVIEPRSGRVLGHRTLQGQGAGFSNAKAMEKLKDDIRKKARESLAVN